jgi:predicted RNA-binding protein with PUA-like domain
MAYWLMKIEPDECSIDDLARLPGRKVPWTGVRNYQARNYMRDQMSIGDGVLYYHSSCAEPGVAGLAEVASAPYADETQFDTASVHFDSKAMRESPRWVNVDVRFVRKTRLLSLAEMRARPELASMIVLKGGNRLSISPVTASEWRAVTTLLAERKR